MSTPATVKKMEIACEAALEKFQKIGLEKYAATQSKLEYVLGSFRFDGNPIGLYEIGEKALSDLKSFQKSKPRSVSKKLIEDLEKAIKSK